MMGGLLVTSRPDWPGRNGALAICPGERLSRRHRRAIERLTWLAVVVAADHVDPSKRAPAAFDEVTLKWAMRAATVIIAWTGANSPASQAELARIKQAHAEPGERVVTIAADGRRSEWLEFARRWKRGAARLVEVDGGA